ncbi:hypothetical protein DZA50_03725 [Kangiella sp. HD9-110m-PIT-SAG07]|nr:hypothetical protein DZA50_03725 [Kangiella sp. HD9-110m-PIT-SAG07]
MQPTVTNKSLIKATVIALVAAAVALVTVILPAEYNIDPTGIGKAIGITVLSNSELPDQEQISQASETKTDAARSKNQSDIIEVTVPAGRGVEYKFQMDQFAKMEYEWITDGSSLHFDLHGEPEGDTTGYFESYAIATLAGMKGSFTAPFAGSHGWYWENNSSEDVSIQLIISGEYGIIGLKE